MTYVDGTKATTEQEASDVIEFLAWASEPHMEDRKRTGVRVILFLLAMAGLMYAVKRSVWSDKNTERSLTWSAVRTLNFS